MDAADLFATVFSAVLAAIMLGGCFFWGLIAYSRREREGTQHTTAGNLIFLAVMMPLLFELMAYLVATDSVPPWLDRILQ